jgi:ABC-type multidrug transport system ATPase subunit
MGGLRVVDHLVWSARMSGVPSHQVHERVKTAVARFGLESSTQKRVSQLSGGTRRRAALAASVVHAPSVVVLDEPDAGLDAAGLGMLADEVSRVQRVGGIVVIAAHGAARERVLSGMPNVVTLPLNEVVVP